MITEEMLRTAAAGAWERYYARLTAEYAPGQTFPVSEGFKNKIRRLKRRADHPVLYRTVRRIAAVLLALLIAGSVWLAVDEEARASFHGWISELTDGYLRFHHAESAEHPGEPMDYRPSWIPDGYWEDSITVFEEEITVRYKNEEGRLIRFSYVNTQDDFDTFYNISGGHLEPCHVGEYEATLFVSEVDDTASAVTWIDSDDTAFHVSGFIPEDELIRMAESVQKLG